MTRPDCPTLPLVPASEHGPFDLRGHMGRWIVPPMVLALATILAFRYDVALSRAVVNFNLPRELDELLSLGEVFGHGVGVLLVGWLIYAVDKRHRWALPRVLGVALSAGLLADVVKMMVTRTRPMYFLENGAVGSTFGGWMPILSAHTAGQSFPSGHTATGIALALMLIWLYPGGKRLFALLGLCVALQRVHSGAHYLSDVLCAATIGWTVAVASCRVPALSGFYSRIEAKLQKRGQRATNGASQRLGDREAA